ncbi:basic juvenile hormone-suppressible protein 2-like [Pieris brassicae]|uniref:basic juvenile hormone-suppressible protein 2-like n=1 Tax=Pieris brassicae TaxID=7116 RepID=UPI001E661ECC|nr:basic juvenile hormone-suppressible protein 2-like [Pieris brassicae]
MWKALFKMFLWLFFLGQILTVPALSKSMELSDILGEGELFRNSEQLLKFIIPGSVSSKSTGQVNLQLTDLVNQEDENFKIFYGHLDAGHAMKGLIFNIYDDSMREATIALFRVFQYADNDKLLLIRDWARENVNKDMFDYAWRLASLYRIDASSKENDPPFVAKPNYYINSDAIIKALQFKNDNSMTDTQVSKVNQIYSGDNFVVVNTNYSSWNMVSEGCEENLDYFREDIALNSYYYGVHLQYPFWMTNDELSGMDARYAERDYFIHQQLLARYHLEKQHYRVRNVSSESNCFRDFNPNLLHDNGLFFPTRSSVLPQWNEQQARIKAIDIAIRECISRGVIYMDNATKTALTEDNYIDLLAKLVRANFDGIQTAKVVKSLFGYGSNSYPSDRYNPAPTVLHNPQTTLRDPLYWQMIQSLLKYFTEYATTLQPFDFSQYESDNFNIIESSSSKITTYFDYYQISLTKFLYSDDYLTKKPPKLFTARQKRLRHLPFTINITVESKVNENGIVKIFLGPECDPKYCWQEHSKFFEMDSFLYIFEKGLNIISWNPEMSGKFSYDDYYNMEQSFSKKNKFDLFKFPENLLIPKGLEEGLNMTVFSMIVPIKDMASNTSDIEYDTLPLGFPFHRQAKINNESFAKNYVFNKVFIYHKKSTNDVNGYFSAHLS